MIERVLIIGILINLLFLCCKVTTKCPPRPTKKEVITNYQPNAIIKPDTKEDVMKLLKRLDSLIYHKQRLDSITKARADSFKRQRELRKLQQFI